MMKVHRKIIIDIASGEVLYDDWYDYYGPTVEVKGTPKFPEPTAEEQAQMTAQTELLQQQQQIMEQMMQQQNLLAPFLYENMGLMPEIDPETGEITGFTQTEDPLDPMRQEIEQLFLERSQAALAGELPVNPALMRDLEDEEATLREMLRKQVGPGYETSTPGIEKLGEFFERKESLLESARRGDLTLAEQLGITRGMANERYLQNLMSNLSGAQGMQLAPSQLMSGIFQGYQGMLDTGYRNRAGQFQQNIYGAQQPSTLQSIFSTAAPFALGAMAGPMFGLSALQGAGISGMGGAGLMPFMNQSTYPTPGASTWNYGIQRY
jgi:hypothetical protein